MIEKSKKYEIKKDRFTRARGGSSSFLLVSCSQCGEPIALYQKDGPGSLLRMYLDKIHAPDDLSASLSLYTQKKDVPNLHCSQCNILLAVPMIYEPEKRLAYRIIRGSVKTDDSDGAYPPVSESEDIKEED